jgi:hypothetical protein
MKKTIAQQLGVTQFPFEIKDKRGNVIYRESLSGYWGKWRYNLQDMEVYYENSEGTIIEDRHYPEPVTDPELKLEPMNQTIAQQLGITKFPFEIRDGNGNLIYIEFENGLWSRWENNEKGWLIYYEGSGGIWERWEYDKEGLVIYYENSKGEVRDNRPKKQQSSTKI